MKTLLSYIFVMSVGIISVCSSVSAQEKRNNFVSHLSSRPLTNEDFSTPMETPVLSITTTQVSLTQKTTSLIYLSNLSEAIDHKILAFNQRNQKAFSTASKRLHAGSLTHALAQNTDSLGALMYQLWLTNLIGSHHFSPNVKTLTRLPYETKGNWGVSPPFGG